MPTKAPTQDAQDLAKAFGSPTEKRKTKPKRGMLVEFARQLRERR